MFWVFLFFLGGSFLLGVFLLLNGLALMLVLFFSYRGRYYKCSPGSIPGFFLNSLKKDLTFCFSLLYRRSPHLHKYQKVPSPQTFSFLENSRYALSEIQENYNLFQLDFPLILLYKPHI